MGKQKVGYYDYKGQMLSVKEIAEIEGCSIQHVYNRIRAYANSDINLYDALRIKACKGTYPSIFRMINVKTGIILEGTPEQLKELLGTTVKLKSLGEALRSHNELETLYHGEWKVVRLCKQIVKDTSDLSLEWKAWFDREWETARKRLMAG